MWLGLGVGSVARVGGWQCDSGWWLAVWLGLVVGSVARVGGWQCD